MMTVGRDKLDYLHTIALPAASIIKATLIVNSVCHEIFYE